MRVIYANPNPMPSADPPSLQVIQTAVGMAEWADVDLIAQRGTIEGRSDRDTVASYYGVRLPDRLHLHLLPGLNHSIGGIRLHWNRFFNSGVAAAVDAVMRSNHSADAILVRNHKLAEFLLHCRPQLGLPPIILESHEVFVCSLQDELRKLGKDDSRKVVRLQRLERYVYEQADGLICITSSLASMIRQFYAIDKPILVAPDGVNPDDFAALPDRRSSSDTNPTVLYLGSLHQWKGVDVLLKALSRLPQVQARIVGGSGKAVQRYRRIAHGLGIENRAHFEGYVPPFRRFETLVDADLFVLPFMPVSIASYFTSPLKLFEYMAARRPIVASDLPAIREVLTDGVNSVLVKPDDPNALAEGIRHVLENPALGVRLAAQAAADVQRYTWASRAQAILEFAANQAHG